MYKHNILLRQLRLLGLNTYSTALEGQKLPETSSSSDGITPPPRIPRGPTDILQALSATVGPDPTAAHYKYHDDPYLIPLSNFRKRAYALAAEAGRKAAVWVRDQHPETFSMREYDPPMKKKTPYLNAEPYIPAYAPKPIYNDESKVTEEDLKYTIDNALLEDSIKVFELLGGVKNVNEELKLQFLQFLCFYNEKEPESAEWMEERWFSSNSQDRHATTWRLGGLADKIFQSMETKTPEAYCTMIQGMAKYYQAERAHMMAREAQEKGIQLSTEVYNSLIVCVGFLKEGTALRVEGLKTVLKEMNDQGLSPNLETLNACLKCLSVWGMGKILQQLALQLLAEFKQLGIKPGLTAYYYLLCLFCKDRGPRIDILSTILNDLESRDKLEPQSATDTHFFITAMGVCSDHLQDLEMAERLHALLMKDDNYRLVGDAYKESIYYRHYVTVACRHAPLERSIELLDTLVPNVYVPEPSVMEQIIKTLEIGGAGDRLAQAWSQLVVFGLAKRIRLVERLLAAMSSCYEYQDEDVKAKMRTAAADVLTYSELTEEQDQQKKVMMPRQKLSATSLCNIIELCSNSTDAADPVWDTIDRALERLRKDEAAGVTNNPQGLIEAAEKAVAVGKLSVAAAVVNYLAETGFEEAMSASQHILSKILNKPVEEIQELLEEPRGNLLVKLQPSALALVDAYHLSKSGGGTVSRRANSSDSSSESDEE